MLIEAEPTGEEVSARVRGDTAQKYAPEDKKRYARRLNMVHARRLNTRLKTLFTTPEHKSVLRLTIE